MVLLFEWNCQRCSELEQILRTFSEIHDISATAQRQKISVCQVEMTKSVVHAKVGLRTEAPPVELPPPPRTAPRGLAHLGGPAHFWSEAPGHITLSYVSFLCFFPIGPFSAVSRPNFAIKH